MRKTITQLWAVVGANPINGSQPNIYFRYTYVCNIENRRLQRSILDKAACKWGALSDVDKHFTKLQKCSQGAPC